MTPTEFEYLLIGAVVVMWVLVLIITYWLFSHNTIIEITYKNKSSVYQKNIRVKLRGNGYYSVNDFFKRKCLLNVNEVIIPEKCQDHRYLNDGGLPYISPKYTIFVILENSQYSVIPLDLKVTDVNEITDTKLSWYASTITNLFKETEPVIENMEIFKQYIIPMGLILLAIIVIIFFPKMMAAIEGNTGQVISATTDTLGDMVSKLLPGGGI
jgi:hypothetical protein